MEGEAPRSMERITAIREPAPGPWTRAWAVQLFGLALVVRLATCISLAPVALTADCFVPVALFLRLDISFSAGLLGGAFLGDGMLTSFTCRIDTF